jgi:LmbE family N-acetylglucosaminyl deacetylase
MFNKSNMNILALSPHADDIELGCGATLSRLKQQGANIFVVNFSLQTSGQEELREVVTKEFKQSMEILGAEYEMLDLPCRRLPSHRQEILEYLIKLSRTRDFDVVFCHSTFDQHQDHQTVQTEAFRAFKNKTILGYELPWNCPQFSTDFFVSLENKHLNKKVEMIDCYKSQSHRVYMCKGYVYDIARTRGLQVQKRYAECFQVIRGVI